MAEVPGIAPEQECAKTLEVRYDPPAYIQRRAFILAALKAASNKCDSLLDVGTGDGALLAFLVRCDDAVPITRMSGIDPNASEIAAAVEETRPRREDAEDPRWRPLQISLYTGGVADLYTHPQHAFECITAVEVLEHLDPPDVQALTKICLGHLQPRMFMVTTPNRDFNRIFERLSTNHGKWFRRAGVDYNMRHDDHRFEMTRQEFQAWANTQCSLYGYTVTFSGVGTVENAFRGQAHWRQTFPEQDTMLSFGHSTQIATFVHQDSQRRYSISGEAQDFLPLRYAITHSFPSSASDGFPPTPEIMKQMLLDAEAYFRPVTTDIDYSRESCATRVTAAELYQTSYAMQRICRFHESTCMTSLQSLVGKHTSFSEEAQLAHADDREPIAKFISAELILAEASTLEVEYMYDVSSFEHTNDPNEASDPAPDANEPAQPVPWNDDHVAESPGEWYYATAEICSTPTTSYDDPWTT